MTSSILSQGEIDALLQGTTSQSRSKAFFDLLTEAFLSAASPLEAEGPYIERLEHTLAQNVAPRAFAVAAELDRQEMLLLMAAEDGERLGQYLGSPARQTVETMSQALVSYLAETLDVSYRVFQGQTVQLDSLSLQAGWAKPSLVRYFLTAGTERLEFCAVIPDLEGLERLAEEAQDRPGRVQRRTVTKGRLPLGSEASISKAVFTPIGELAHVQDEQGLNLLEDIDLTITVELGSTTLTLSEILDLKPQSVIRLERLAGEPVDVYVNDSRVARGEVVVLEENFGVRILEIVPQRQRRRE